MHLHHAISTGISFQLVLLGMAGGRILESFLMLAHVLDNGMSAGEHGRRPKTFKKTTCTSTLREFHYATNMLLDV